MCIIEDHSFNQGGQPAVKSTPVEMAPLITDMPLEHRLTRIVGMDLSQNSKLFKREKSYFRGRYFCAHVSW